jgi:hypothetical protein
MRDPIIFDVEAIAIDDAGNYLEAVEAPANYKDPIKIDAYKAEKQQELLSRCALDPDLARIVALGTEQAGVEQVQILSTTAEEADALNGFWNRIRPYPFPRLIGYNVLGYDLLLMMRRSLYLGVKVPPLQVGKYRHPDVDDLMVMLSFDGALKYRGMGFYCKRFGIDVPDEHSGKDIAALMAEGNTAAVVGHCLADLRKTRQLAERMGVLEPVALSA